MRKCVRRRLLSVVPVLLVVTMVAFSVPVSATAATDATTALIARPSMGVAPLTVTFSFVGAPAGATMVLDADGDGIADASGSAGNDASFTYAKPGLYVATASVGTGAAPARAIVQVLDRATLDAALQATWTAMKDALRAGQVEQALQYVALADRDDYRVLLKAMTVPLSSIDLALGDIVMIGVGERRAEYQMIRVDQGVRLSYFVLFVQDADDVWRVKFF